MTIRKIYVPPRIVPRGQPISNNSTAKLRPLPTSPQQLVPRQYNANPRTPVANSRVGLSAAKRSVIKDSLAPAATKSGPTPTLPGIVLGHIAKKINQDPDSRATLKDLRLVSKLSKEYAEKATSHMIFKSPGDLKEFLKNSYSNVRSDAQDSIPTADLEPLKHRFSPTTITLENWNIDAHFSAEDFALLPHGITSLELSYFGGKMALTSEHFSALNRYENLREVRFKLCSLDDTSNSCPAFLSKMRKIEFNRIKSSDEFIKMVGGLNNLESLKIDKIDKWDEWAKTIGQMQHLPELSLAQNIQFDHLNDLAQSKSINKLNLEGSEIHNLGQPSILRLLKNMQELTHLCLNKIKLGDDDLEGLKVATNIKKIELKGSSFTTGYTLYRGQDMKNIHYVEDKGWRLNSSYIEQLIAMGIHLELDPDDQALFEH